MRPVALLVLLFGCAPVAPAARRPDPLRIGVAEVDITPPQGHRMAGYFYERLNTGTKDPLKAKAMVFAQGETRLALVFCDLVGVPASVAVRARQQAEKRTGIPAAHIAVAATHSHTGPLYYGFMHQLLEERAPRKSTYAAALTDRIAEAVEKAHAALRPGRLEAGVARQAGVSYNRRFLMKDGRVRTNPGSLNPEIVKPVGPIDPEVGILVVRHDSEAVASLTVFACHCDTVGGTEYSADYPYFLERELRASLGESFLSLFGAGTCGNINHIDVTTKERRKSDALGKALAGDVLAQVPKLAPVRPSLALRNERVEVPTRRPTPEETAEARRNVEKVGSKDFPFLDQVRTCTTLHLTDLPAVWPLEVQAFRIGADTAIVTLPGEVFVEHGLAIKKASPFRHTLVIELANDNCAYVPTREAFAEGAYEVVNSRIKPGGGERLVEAAVRLLKELAP